MILHDSRPPVLIVHIDQGLYWIRGLRKHDVGFRRFIVDLAAVERVEFRVVAQEYDLVSRNQPREHEL